MEVCDVCGRGFNYKKYMLNIPDGYLEVCSKTCGRKEYIKWFSENIKLEDLGK